MNDTSQGSPRKDPRVYDRIGTLYSRHRRADSRLVDAIVDLLEIDAPAEIADVGAGSGNYSRALADRGFHVTAIEPSAVMRRQAPGHPQVEWRDGVAEAIPLPNGCAAAVTCVLAFHHFGSPRPAIDEMARVSRGPIVLFTYDPRAGERLWLQDYFPEMFEEAHATFPPLSSLCEMFREAGLDCTTRAFDLPHDLEDLFLAAGWRRPEMYLDEEVRACMSVFALADAGWVEARIARLREDLASGAWERRNGRLMNLQAFDAGYRFVCARRAVTAARP